MENQNIEINPEIPGNAISIYNQGDAMDDFPVLKAFQQYIDAEHAKARKRLMSLGIFFGIFTGVIIAVFVVLLMNVSARNQALNDRLIEFAMKDRDRGQAAVVVQPPIQQDNSVLMAVTAKLEALQKELKESHADKTESIEKPVAPEKPKGPSVAEMEVVRLRALLDAEREKLAEEKKRQREQELEAYRRKHYPELYGLKPQPENVLVAEKRQIRKKARIVEIEEDVEDDIDDIDLDSDDAISYFDEEDEEELPRPKKRRKAPSSRKTETPAVKHYSIPVEVRGSKSSWQIPND